MPARAFSVAFNPLAFNPLKKRENRSKRLDIGNLKAHFLNLTCFVNNYCATQSHLDFDLHFMQPCQPTEPNASWILPILSHFHASLAIQPRENESHIMSEDRCQKSFNLLASNHLKCRREFSHSMPKRHRHRMSKKWSIITAVIKFKLMTKRQN